MGRLACVGKPLRRNLQGADLIGGGSLAFLNNNRPDTEDEEQDSEGDDS